MECFFSFFDFCRKCIFLGRKLPQHICHCVSLSCRLRGRFKAFRAQINTFLGHNNTATANCWRVLVQKGEKKKSERNSSLCLHKTVKKTNAKGTDEHDERGKRRAAQHLLSVKSRADCSCGREACIASLQPRPSHRSQYIPACVSTAFLRWEKKSTSRATDQPFSPFPCLQWERIWPCFHIYHNTEHGGVACPVWWSQFTQTPLNDSVVRRKIAAFPKDHPWANTESKS